MQHLFNLPEGTYLLSHSVGCLPKQAQQTLQHRYLTPWQQQGGDAWPAWLGIIDDFCAQLALILGADGADICPQSNVSSGLSKYLMALPRRPDKNIIVMHASAFPSMGFVAQALTPLGYELKLIDEQMSPCDLAGWQQHICAKTALVLVTHVHSNSGLLSPVADIARLAHSQRAKVVVDIAQSVGVVPIDVKQWQVDCVVGSCVKWLCGGPGAGFIWLQPGQLNELQPMDVGWFSHSEPFEFDIRHFDYAADARRFWGGTPSIAPFATALGSLQQINQISVKVIAAHNHQLRQTIYQAAQSLLLSVHQLSAEGGTLCLDLAPAVFSAALTQLKSMQVHFDQRSSVLRLSWHIYNTEQQAAQIAQLFHSLRG